MGVSSEGEFHEFAESASEVLLTGVAPSGEIHLKSQPAPEPLLKGVHPKGEFHEGEFRGLRTRKLPLRAFKLGEVHL